MNRAIALGSRITQCSIANSLLTPDLHHTARYATLPLEWLASFTNYEKTGVPDAAGTDTERGFDLVSFTSPLEFLLLRDATQQSGHDPPYFILYIDRDACAVC